VLAILLVPRVDAPATFDFARETIVQLITLSTGVIGVSATFAKDFRNGRGAGALFVSWIALLVSIVFGVWALMALTGTLAREPVTSDAIYMGNITFPAMAQTVTFLVGIAALIWHAIIHARAEGATKTRARND
jgi:hypothetical protein